MGDPGSVLQKVRKLKRHLSCTHDPQKIMQLLKGLRDLEISLDILVETGVGKTVNSLRKHATVGELAKSLIRHWKKLVPQDNTSTPTLQKQTINREKGTSDKKTRTLISKESKHFKKSQTSESNCNFSVSSGKPKKAQSVEEKPKDEAPGSFRGCESQRKNEASNNGMCKDTPTGQEIGESKNICKASNDREKSLEKRTSFVASNQSSNKNHLAAASRKDFLHLEVDKSETDPITKQIDTGLKGTQKSNSGSQSLVNNEALEHHSLSFESYLNYDHISQRRKRKSCPTGRQMAKGPRNSASWKSVTTAAAEERKKQKSEECSEMPSKKAKTSLQDLLNIPLPKVLPELSPPYATEFKVSPSMETPPEKSEATQFTVPRRNSKIQVYSGSKMVYLSKMLTLYEQCIRVLQNNIDSLHEVGGVPFEFLEPVLAHCTPEQLFRIENCNPTFVEESDHLWKKHCQKYFRNEQLLECESWREMYLRLFVQREEKLKFLTQSIISAHFEKPKGRQVKMAFIHGVAKPPRNVSHQQVIYGTSGPVFQLQPKSKNSKKQERNRTSSISNKGSNIASTRLSIYKNGPTQVVKKPAKKIAPIMKKSLTAFKNRFGPR